MKNHSENNKQKKISVPIWGIILYSVLLIAVMVGAYFLVHFTISAPKDSSLPQDPAPSTETEASKPLSSELSIPTESAQTISSAQTEPSQPAESLLNLSAIMTADNYKIDYTTIHFQPAKRDVSLTWKDTVFSTLENLKDPSNAKINTYKFTRKWATRDDGKPMEFEIYTNPETDKIEKITAIEHCGDYLEIMDYYYDNGKINYIAQHQTIIDTPIDISSASVTGRYYFNQDVMVKYSSVEGTTAIEYLLSHLDQYSDGAVSQYNYLEQTMINWAYTTLNAIPALTETEFIEGYVLDEFNSAMSDVEVVVISDSTEKIILKTTTDGNGFYSFTLPVNNNDTFTIRARKQTLEDTFIYNVKALSGCDNYYANTIYMSYIDNVNPYDANITLYDATSNTSLLPGATLTIRNGINALSGDVIATGISDNNGLVKIALRSGNYTGEIKKDDYETAYFPIVINRNHTIVSGYTIKTLNEKEMQIITTHSDSALDIDTLLFTASIPAYVSSKNTGAAPIAESMKVLDSHLGVYKFFAYDYNNCVAGDSMNYALSSSNALVTIFNADGYVDSYSVPAAHGGVIWNVLQIRNGIVLPINHYYSVIPPNSYWTSK